MPSIHPHFVATDTVSPTTTEAEAFLRKVANADATSHNAIAIGHNIRVDNVELVDAALIVDDCIICLSAFAPTNNAGRIRKNRSPYTVCLTEPAALQP